MPSNFRCLFPGIVLGMVGVIACTTGPEAGPGNGEPVPGAAPPASPAPPVSDRTLPEPDYLPELARALLRDQMAHHAVEAISLAWEVSLLEYDQVADIAERMAAAPRIARPHPGATDELNTRLPAAFFDLQDALRDNARDLAEAAGRRDPEAVAVAYGRLARTCVQCHAVYLEPPEEAPDLD